MLKNIYSPLSGALAQEKVLEMIANNLANMNTNGFKGDRVTFTLLESEPEKNYSSPVPEANYKVQHEDLQYLRGNEMAYVGVASIDKDFSQGPAIKTENSTDLMIEGEGFFAVSTKDGIRYTRDGSFTLNQNGVIVTKSGDPLVGEKGAISVREGDFKINNIGEVWEGDQLIDRIVINKISNPAALERVGKNLYFHDGPASSVEQLQLPQMRQGFLEGSNVNAIRSLTNMIMAHRSHEAYHKAMSNYDKMMERSSNQIGEIRV